MSERKFGVVNRAHVYVDDDRHVCLTPETGHFIHEQHDFSVPVLGGMLRCSKWKCGAVTKPALAQEHSAESKSAAEWAETVRRGQQQLIWNALALAGDRGLTTEELCQQTGVEGSSARPRLVELDEQHRAERVTVNGLPYHPVTNKAVVTRTNFGGHAMCVWRAIR